MSTGASTSRIRGSRPRNAYTDISYTLHDRRIVPLLKMFLLDPVVRERVLFGTDFYLLEKDASERELSMAWARTRSPV